MVVAKCPGRQSAEEPFSARPAENGFKARAPPGEFGHGHAQ
jgi:hypothetical protein